MTESESLETRKKRLRFRSWHRGTREMDLLIGGFIDANLESFDQRQVGLMEDLLRQSDPDLYAWIAGKASPPPDSDHEVMHRLRAHRFEPPGP